MKTEFVYRLILLSLSFSLIHLSSVQAQKEVKIYQIGEKYLLQEDYNTALNYFQQVAQINATHASIPYKIPLCQAMIDDQTPLSGYLKLEKAFSVDEYYYYWLGKIYMSRYQFSDAIVAFEKFREKAEYNGNKNTDEIQLILSQTKYLVTFFENPDDFEIHQLEAPINSVANELSPVYFEDKKELIFASSRENEDHYKIYHTKKGTNGWAEPTELKNLGIFSEKTANVEVINEDGKLFIFREENGGDLFYSQPSGESWSTPVEFDSRVSNNQLASHFFINAHEDRIIFASDNKKTGLDIYESYKDSKNGNWSRPAPFSNNINSEANEDSPYLSDDETKLYFTSNRAGGVGGFDVYVSELNTSDYSWSEPKNLGWPINSPDNEHHFKMNGDQSSGYFVSDRLHTKGAYDIYFFWTVEKVQIQGRILDLTTGKALENGEIRFHPSQYMDEYFGSKTNDEGRYESKIISDETFKVEILKDGRVIHTEQFEIHDSNNEATTHHKDFKVKG